ncbi:helix-turn-helix domain-containing protein [Salipiger marinus]|uniref:helix-turn-helix domain-containing protein n=1 Tax=Salipiger marinus TaxID=555512 RepID=UPI002BAC6983|nr:helix-turn-helix transcriptional regulator [Salipiger manganoxidans]MEB3421752.1 helix-turn-helix transcriptional regulator [Salipiger manganoxidans]
MPKIDLESVGMRLTAVRTASGLTSGQFANTVSIDPSSYSKIELGKKPLNVDMGFRVSERWGVSMDFLYRGRLNEVPESIIRTLRAIENEDR